MTTYVKSDFEQMDMRGSVYIRALCAPEFRNVGAGCGQQMEDLCAEVCAFCPFGPPNFDNVRESDFEQMDMRGSVYIRGSVCPRI